jgi:hypothetical protein
MASSRSYDDLARRESSLDDETSQREASLGSIGTSKSFEFFFLLREKKDH